ncbi:PspC domain-containing protein [Aeromicrobium sp. Leaf350]|uniref:PspC domain-containing protein n=1 Tax=Aeromicrobium sp. Leaf350 TaxID=2876565 RepID=UPI001E611EA3|nr:PspC domain-containing protein [Aeromicrobium sp. Leaf350]
MNQTTTPPPPPPGAQHPGDGGPDRERFRSVTSTRRSTDGRLIAGVASGLGRQLGIDPIIVRIVLVALCFAGLAGLVLYGAAWLALPPDDGRPSVLADWFRLDETEPQARVVVLAIGAALALASIIGDTGWWWGVSTPLFTLWLVVPALFFYWLFAVRPRQRREGTPPPPVQPWPAPPSAGPTTTFSATPPSAAGPVSDPDEAPTTTDAADDEPTAVLDDDEVSDDASDAGDPPPPPTAGPGPAEGWPSGPVPPPVAVKPRTPPTLFLATMSVVLIVLGGLATVHAGAGLDLPPQVYPAVALGIVGLGLLVGARWGRSIALVPIGLVLSVVLLAVGAVPDGPLGDVRRTPVSAADVAPEYELGAGSLRLDLSQVRNPEQLLGRTIVIDGGLGQVRVILPDDLAVTVEAEISGGQIRILGEETSGQGASLDVVSDERPALTIEIDHTFGQIDVERA